MPIPPAMRKSWLLSLLAAVGWILLALVSYLRISLFLENSLLYKLLLVWSWLWSLLWSLSGVLSYLAVKAYGRSMAVLTATSILGLLIWTADWKVVYLQSQIRLHHETFADLASSYESGRPLEVPSWMKYLSIEGDVQAQEHGLYFPVFVDKWRAESGEGFAYIPGKADPQTIIQTAEGDIGGPTHDLGEGWWWVE
ncbi:hypothetical protein [Streptosporangium amethystogenes]|uniref:hypothetical protein n=1 Tax=Streptosporangium amethystogenes TaxID=2002 RepID=UPI0012FACBAF|nr:hypothetical protein [Streptosporangium amethystogenes]